MKCDCGNKTMMADTEDWQKPLCPQCYELLEYKVETPIWCDAPEANTALGCWSLISVLVKNKEYCKRCEYKKAGH